MNVDPSPVAWLVIAGDGFRALFLTRSRADQYAVNTHGTVWPLFREKTSP